MLAGLMSSDESRGPLRADFRRFYGTSVDILRAENAPLTEVADMAAYLPPESATARAGNPYWMHTHDLEIARRVEFHLRWLVWAKTKDGEKGRNLPEPYYFPWEDDPNAPIRGEVMDVDSMADWLGWSEQLNS